MELIYQSLDTLDIAFKCALSRKALSILEDAKTNAIRNRSDQFITLGENALKICLKQTGAKGGYRYMFDTGEDGEIWCIKSNENGHDWNIRISVKSLALNIHGYYKVKKRLLNRLKEFGAIGEEIIDEDTGEVKRIIQERISRFDYCFDFKDTNNSFEPKVDNIVCHQRTTKTEHGNVTSSTTRGNKTETIQIGRMPNKQICIYNKTKEIQTSKKNYMWNFWKLTPKSFKGTVWRIEVRAGRNAIDRFKVKRFKEFEENIEKYLKNCLKTYRYTSPLKNDSNRSRWPNHKVWDTCLKKPLKDLSDFKNDISLKNYFKEKLEDKVEMFENNIIGQALSLTALKDRSLEDTKEILLKLAEKISLLSSTNDTKALKKIEEARNKYAALIT